MKTYITSSDIIILKAEPPKHLVNILHQNLPVEHIAQDFSLFLIHYICNIL